MVDEPDNPILKLLREIRAKLDDHDREFAKLNKKIDDWGESTAMSLGLASHANVRSNSMEEEIADLKRRVERLEEAR